MTWTTTLRLRQSHRLDLEDVLEEVQPNITYARCAINPVSSLAISRPRLPLKSGTPNQW